VRTGKAAGSKANLRSRVLEHATAAAQPTTESKFYLAYSNTDARLGAIGPWTYLKHYIGIAFRRSDRAAVEESFPLTEAHRARLEAVKGWGPDTAFAHAISYVWELAYQLCLDQSKCLSSNPGWETVLGAWSM